MSRATVLVVDDDPALAECIADVLDAKGFCACVANDGFVALDLVRKDDYEVILMDIRMPGMNGVEASKKIKELKPGIKQILMTAYSSENLIQEALNVGALQVLNKPIDLDSLVAMIDGL